MLWKYMQLFDSGATRHNDNVYYDKHNGDNVSF